ncbi:MAG: DUF2892 domain-containing protein [Rhodocyclaceae bacterium]|nr:DUF2892 domain-containing protein [Rhodocyclaceae bacterium]
MTLNRLVRLIAGSFILVSLALAHINGQADLSQLSWLWFTGCVGANLFQSGITRFCPMDGILRRLGVPEDKDNDR